MTRSNRLICLLGMVCMTALVSAQTLEIGGQVRPRFEMRKGYKTLPPANADAAMFISQRSRLNVLFGQAGIRAGLSLQDVRTWGDVPQLNAADRNGPALHEAWGEATLAPWLAIRAGRQELSYDDQRILGSVDWAQQGRSHDALLFMSQPSEKSKLHLALAFNQEGEALFGTDYSIAGNYKALQFLWYQITGEKLTLSVLALNNGMAFTDLTDSLDPTQQTVYSHTIGPRAIFRTGKMQAHASFYYQGGKDAGKRDLSAYYASAELMRELTDHLRAGAGIEYLSGTDQGGIAKENHSFTPLYGTNHKFNGWMDYFYVGNHSNSVGLMDIHIPVHYKRDAYSFSLIPHFFSAAAAIADPEAPEKEMERYLGTEIDLMFAYRLSAEASISCGLSLLQSTDALKALKGGEEKTASWGWVMLDIKPWRKDKP